MVSPSASGSNVPMLATKVLNLEMTFEFVNVKYRGLEEKKKGKKNWWLPLTSQKKKILQDTVIIYSYLVLICIKICLHRHSRNATHVCESQSIILLWVYIYAQFFKRVKSPLVTNENPVNRSKPVLSFWKKQVLSATPPTALGFYGVIKPEETPAVQSQISIRLTSII